MNWALLKMGETITDIKEAVIFWIASRRVIRRAVIRNLYISIYYYDDVKRQLIIQGHYDLIEGASNCIEIPASKRPLMLQVN